MLLSIARLNRKNFSVCLNLLSLFITGLLEKKKTPTLVSLCLGVVGKHLEDVIEDLDEIAINFPADIKVA